MPEYLGRYRIKRRLGGGGMGAVYLVENTELQRDEALKVPHFETGSDPSIRERFLRETRLAARLDHPNLCPIYDAGVIDGIYFLTMRYLEGKPLSAYTGRPLPPREAIKIVTKLAQVLEHAHARGVIHRDLKPSNIMICPGTGPTVFDFGLAKQTRQAGRKLTQTGTTLGTPAYMPPEQVTGDLDRIGPASDAYSLGVILFELLTGCVPFRGSMVEVLSQVILDQAPPPSRLRPGLYPELDAVCAKALAKAPEQRYASMNDFSAALTDVLRVIPARETGALDAAASNGECAAGLVDMTTVPPTTPRRKSGVAWLCLALLLTGSLLAPLLWLTDKHLGRSTNQTAEEKADEDSKERTGNVLAGPGTNTVPNEPPKMFTNTIGMKLVRIPPGKFKMGSPDGEAGRNHPAEEQLHDVEITKTFHLGAFEVTQQQFREVMGYNPSYFSSNAKGRDGVKYRGKPGARADLIRKGEDSEQFPVENVSCDEAREFCEKLTAKDNSKPDGWSYRLPTEAEWEYACRGGSPTYQVFHFGNSLSGKQANFDSNHPYGGADKLDPRHCPRMVGSYEANRFGLHDMHGNVWEWCLDWYHTFYYSTSPPKDPPGPPENPPYGHVARGGGWNYEGWRCRSAIRHHRRPEYRDNLTGFRVALVPPAK
jgi:formylglycine-generating enzyme required for sulfatase activity